MRCRHPYSSLLKVCPGYSLQNPVIRKSVSKADRYSLVAVIHSLMFLYSFSQRNTHAAATAREKKTEHINGQAKLKDKVTYSLLAAPRASLHKSPLSKNFLTKFCNGWYIIFIIYYQPKIGESHSGDCIGLQNRLQLDIVGSSPTSPAI